MRAIDADALIDAFHYADDNFGMRGLIGMIEQAIDAQPAITERTTERFAEVDGTVCCKACGVGGIEQADGYCYYCGAKFKEAANG